MFKEGDRIRLVSMHDDPDPVPAGTEGTVQFCTDCSLFRPPFTQVGVAWDNGRSLMLCIPPDRAVRVS